MKHPKKLIAKVPQGKRELFFDWINRAVTYRAVPPAALPANTSNMFFSSIIQVEGFQKMYS